MAERLIKVPTSTICSHCEGYAAEFKLGDLPKQEGPHAVASTAREGEYLCGNCNLVSPAKRDAEKKFAVQVAEGRRKADEAAKKAYADAIRDLNEKEVNAAMGDEDKKARIKGAE